MEYVYPSRFKLNEKDKEKARRIYKWFVWFLLGNLIVFIALKIYVWINTR